MDSGADRSQSFSYAEALRDMTRRYERLVQALSILRQMDEIDAPGGDIEEMSHRILRAIASGLDAENCSLMLLDDKGECLELCAAYSALDEGPPIRPASAPPGPKFYLGEGIAGKVAQTGRPIRIEEVAECPEFVQLDLSPVQIHSLLCFPLRIGGKTAGVLNLSHSEPAFFSSESEHILALVAERAARIFTGHQLRQKIRETEAHYRLVAENAVDAILVFDRHGKLTSANPAAQSITGIPAERYFRGEADWESGIHPEDRPRFAAHRQQLLSSPQPLAIEYRYLDVHGEAHDLEQRSAPLLDPSRHTIGIVCVARDATERKRAEQELTLYRAHLEELVQERSAELVRVNQDLEREIAEHKRTEEALREARDQLERRVEERTAELRCANESLQREIAERKRAEDERRAMETQVRQAQKLESLGVLAGGIAHDFNNLLEGILGNAGLALEDLPPAAPARRRVERIVKAAQRAADMTRQLLAYSGKGRFFVEPIDLTQLVHEMAQLLKVSLSKKASLKLNLCRSLPAIEADAAQIRQVVMNLITNASEALGEQAGQIALRTGAVQCDPASLADCLMGEGLPKGPYVYVEVADTGCGMDNETLAKIFDPFFTTKFTGRGLGLAAVLGIVRGHCGALKVQSQPGQGTTFRVLFPASTKPASSEPKAPQSCEALRGAGAVLVADDEEVVSSLARDVLERAGFKVFTAADGRQTIEIFRRHAGDIVAVLLDLTMPHLSGSEALDEIRRIRSDVPVILSSGYGEEEAVKRLGAKGLAGFIQKPYLPPELLAKMKQALCR